MKRIRSLHQDQRGVSAVIVAISLIALMGAAMLSLDAGNMWQTRRNIVTATDATALQQAKYFAFQSAQSAGTTQACPTSGNSWTDYLIRNAGSGSTPIDCTATWKAGGTGYVVVQGRKTSKTRFGTVLGIGDTQPFSLSAAAWGYPTKVEGLRPMGVCSANDHFRQWVALKANTITQAQYDALADTGDVGVRDGPDADVFIDAAPPDGTIDYPVYPSVTGVVHRIVWNKDQPDECGDPTNGNWGYVDFNGGSNSNADTKDWILNGYSGNVGVNDCNADGVTGDPCSGDPGSSGGSVASELQTLVDNQTKFAVPIYDTATANGSNATFGMYAFVGVILRGFDANGTQANRYFDFEFVDLQLSGVCCAATPPTVDTGVRATKLCDVDHDTAAGQTVATRCA